MIVCCGCSEHRAERNLDGFCARSRRPQAEVGCTSTAQSIVVTSDSHNSACRNPFWYQVAVDRARCATEGPLFRSKLAPFLPRDQVNNYRISVAISGPVIRHSRKDHSTVAWYDKGREMYNLQCVYTVIISRPLLLPTVLGKGAGEAERAVLLSNLPSARLPLPQRTV